MKHLVDISKADLSGKKVLVRADFNVPLGSDGVVDRAEAARIDQGMKTVRYLSEAGARVAVISHLGRDGQSLLPAAEYINQVLGFDIGFVPQITGDLVHDMVNALPHGGVLLLENLRQHPGEKANDAMFAEELSTYGDIFVNDAFSVSHREHASVVGLPKLLPAYAGMQFADEYNNLKDARNPNQPAMLILAGAKFGTKLALLQDFLNKTEVAFVGGALANNFFKAKGLSVGDSLVDDQADISHLIENPKILLPLDVTVQNPAGETRITNPIDNDIQADEVITDCGPATLGMLRERAAAMSTVIWNGPLGNYEIGFAESTKQLARDLAGVSADVYAGGGDTVTVLQMDNLMGGYAFVSMAGGAMLDFLVSGDLPGLRALE